MPDYSDIEALRSALVGRSVVKVEMPPPDNMRVQVDYETAEGVIHLDDGTILAVAGNTGGCACSAGDYDLTRLNGMPINGITDVQVIVDDVDPDDDYSDAAYRLFVLAQDERIELATFEGDDGNGYYGTGFYFDVIKG